MIAKLLTEHHLEFLSLKGAAEARLSLHLSKYHIVGNLTHWIIFPAFFSKSASVTEQAGVSLTCTLRQISKTGFRVAWLKLLSLLWTGSPPFPDT